MPRCRAVLKPIMLVLPLTLLQGNWALGGELAAKGVQVEATREADAAFASGDYHRATDLYRQAAAAEPANASVQMKLALACLGGHLEAEALRAAQAAVAIAPDDPPAKAVLAKALIRNGDYQGGLTAFAALPVETRGLYGLDPCVQAARLALVGQEHIGKGYPSQQQADFARGAESLERALRVDPDNLAIKKTLGWLYLDKMHEARRAYPHLDQLVALQPDDLGSKKLLALACSGTGRLERAVSLYHEVIAKDPADLWMRVNLGEALAYQGEFAAATATYEEVLRLDPNSVSARLGMARIAAWRGDTQDAVSRYQGILKDFPKSPEAHTQYADLCRWEWMLALSRQQYETALDASPGYGPAQSGLEELDKMRRLVPQVEYYTFEDSGSSIRSFVGTSVRVPMPYVDNMFFTPDVRRWRFATPGFPTVHRWDEGLAVEYHAGRKLQAQARLFSYNYEHENAEVGFGLSGRLTPAPRTNLYVGYVNHEPVVDSIVAILLNYSQDIYSLGADVAIWGALTVQGTYALARYSDDNLRHDFWAQLSYKLFAVPDVNVRARYELLGFSDEQMAYFSPADYQMYRLSVDCSHDVTKWLAVYAVGELPYVKEAADWGDGLRAGSRITLHDRVSLFGEYTRYWLPGPATPWSGDGWRAGLSCSF